MRIETLGRFGYLVLSPYLADGISDGAADFSHGLSWPDREVKALGVGNERAELDLKRPVAGHPTGYPRADGRHILLGGLVAETDTLSRHVQPLDRDRI